MEIRTLETFVEGVKEEGASEPCKYVQFDKQEAQRLLDYIVELQYRIDKAIEYITSYESIEEIQHCERIEDNKELDYNTMVEMNRRYLIVHDKLLDILRGEDNEDR